MLEKKLRFELARLGDCECRKPVKKQSFQLAQTGDYEHQNLMKKPSFELARSGDSGYQKPELWACMVGGLRAPEAAWWRNRALLLCGRGRNIHATEHHQGPRCFLNYCQHHLHLNKINGSFTSRTFFTVPLLILTPLPRLSWWYITPTGTYIKHKFYLR